MLTKWYLLKGRPSVIKWTRWPSVESSQPLSPDSPVCSVGSSVVTAMTELETLPRLDMDFLSPRLLEIITATFPTCKHQKPVLSLTTEPGGRVITLHPSHQSREQFLLIVIAFPTCSAYPRVKIFPFQNPLFTVMVSHTTLLPTKKLISQQMKCSNGHIHGIHWSYHKLNCPEAAGLIQWLNGLSKIQWQN